MHYDVSLIWLSIMTWNTSYQRINWEISQPAIRRQTNQLIYHFAENPLHFNSKKKKKIEKYICACSKLKDHQEFYDIFSWLHRTMQYFSEIPSKYLRNVKLENVPSIGPTETNFSLIEWTLDGIIVLKCNIRTGDNKFKRWVIYSALNLHN